MPIDRIPAVLTIKCAALLIAGGLHRGSFKAVLRREAPHWENQDETVLMGGRFMLFWFTLGLVVMLLILNL